MIGVWLFLPVVALGMLAISAAVRAAADEAARLGREVERFGDLRLAVVELRDELGRTHSGVSAVRGRRPGRSA